MFIADISYSAAQLLVVIVVSVTVLTQFCQCYRQNDIIHKLTNILHEIVTVGKAVELLGDSVKQKLNEIADRISEMVKDKLTKKTDEPNLVVMDIEEIFDKKMLVEEHVV